MHAYMHTYAAVEEHAARGLHAELLELLRVVDGVEDHLLVLHASLSFLYGASIAQLVDSRSWIRKALSSILASATTEWVLVFTQSLQRNLKPEIP